MNLDWYKHLSYNKPERTHAVGAVRVKPPASKKQMLSIFIGWKNSLATEKFEMALQMEAWWTPSTSRDETNIVLLWRV